MSLRGRTSSWRRGLLGLVVWLATCFATAAIGAAASINAAGFYERLDRPPWAPPAAVFGPTWSVLFLAMGVAAWLAWRQRGFRGSGLALPLFLVHLPVNALWSWLFFGWQLGAASFANVVVLWLLIAAMLPLFWRIHRVAGLLLAPYLAWVSFAAVLNYATWQRNVDLLGSV